MFHGPLVSSKWEPLAPRRTTEPSKQAEETSERDDEDSARPPDDIRERMVVKALALLDSPVEKGDYGAQDLADALAGLDRKARWSADQGLRRLVELAEKQDAYDTDGRPKDGDIVLFHNQLDANGNGETDDWLTGCGVVVAGNGARFDAVVRTGHRARRVSAWPNGPKRRIVNGEVVNSFLRIPHRSDSPGVQYLAGSLYAGHIDIEELFAGK